VRRVLPHGPIYRCRHALGRVCGPEASRVNASRVPSAPRSGSIWASGRIRC